MGYIGSDPKTKESVSTSQLVDDSVTNPKIVDDIQFNSVTASFVSSSTEIVGKTFTGTFSGALSSSAQIGASISGSFTSPSSSLSTRVTAVEAGSTSKTLVSSSVLSSPSQGTIRLATNGVNTDVDSGLQSSDSPTFAGVTVTGTLTAQEIHTEFESASILFTSGSTIFGNSSDDIHNMTGSLNVSGSLFVKDGTLTVTDNVDFNGDLDVDGTTNLDNTDIDGTLTVDGGNIVFNDDSADIDFRVEGNGDANLLFTEGETDRIGIGTSNPDGKVHIHTASAGSVSAHVSADELVVEGSANSGINILSGNSNEGGIYFGDDGDNDIGRIRYDHSNNSLDFFANASERMMINSSGYVGIGISTPSSILEIASDTYPQFIINGTDNSGNIGLILSGSGERGGIRWNGSNNDVEILREGGDVEISLLDGGGTTFKNEVKVDNDTEAIMTVRRGSRQSQLAQNSSGAVLTLLDSSGNTGAQISAYSQNFLANNTSMGGTHTAASDFGFTPLLHLKKDGDIAFVLDNATEKFELVMNDDADHLRLMGGSTADIISFENSGEVYVGTRQNVLSKNTSHRFNVQGPASTGAWISTFANNSYPTFQTYRTNNTTIGSYTATADTDIIGAINFHGSSASAHTLGAAIDVRQDGSANTYTPTRIDFYVSNGSNISNPLLSLDGPTQMVGIGTKAPSQELTVVANSGNEIFLLKNTNDSGPQGMLIHFSAAAPDNSTNKKFAQLYDNAADRVAIWSDGDIQNHDNSYGQISDERIKTSITDANSQWDDIKALKVKNFKRKDDVSQYGDNAWTQIGVIAQDLESAGMDKLVKNCKPSEFEINNCGISADDYTKGVKYSVLYMKAVKALQEAMIRIETLEKRIEALESN